MKPKQFNRIDKWFKKIYLQTSFRFWKPINIIDLIGIIVTVVSISLALISLNHSRKSLDLSIKTIKKSDSLELVNRHNDSIRYIADTTYKGEVRRLQDKQQKLLGTLVDLTDKMIEEKKFSDRAKVEIEELSLTFDSTKFDDSNYYFFSNYKFKNNGTRNAKDVTIKEYYYLNGSNTVLYLLNGPYCPFSKGEGLDRPTVLFANKSILNSDLWIFVLIEIDWTDEEIPYLLHNEMILFFTAKKNGVSHGIYLTTDKYKEMKERILSKKVINLNSYENRKTAFKFYPDFLSKSKMSNFKE